LILHGLIDHNIGCLLGLSIVPCKSPFDPGDHGSLIPGIGGTGDGNLPGFGPGFSVVWKWKEDIHGMNHKQQKHK
jgi:hypothetical protein